MQMRDFCPFKEDAATLDAGVSLTSRGRKFQQLYALNGAARAYMDQGPQVNALFPQMFGTVFEVFERDGSGAPRFQTQCGVFNLALNNGRSEALSAQVFGPDGRVAVRGKVDFMKALVDLDFAAQPVDGEVQYLDAVGSFASPAVSSGARQAPWLTLANTKDKMCEVLRQQSQAALDG